ncbi:hypothetical protein EDD86DRAFT_65114 [Gorgonomyces haynaldii]|nr:hypothetical protein EDD86DRAFT_65114 [Gorgonomyces haynaldii]
MAQWTTYTILIVDGTVTTLGVTPTTSAPATTTTNSRLRMALFSVTEEQQPTTRPQPAGTVVRVDATVQPVQTIAQPSNDPLGTVYQPDAGSINPGPKTANLNEGRSNAPSSNNTLVVFVASFFAVTIAVLAISALGYRRVRRQQLLKKKMPSPSDLPSILLRPPPQSKQTLQYSYFDKSTNDIPQPVTALRHESILPIAHPSVYSIDNQYELESDTDTQSRASRISSRVSSYLQHKTSTQSFVSRPVSGASSVHSYASAESLSKYMDV